MPDTQQIRDVGPWLAQCWPTVTVAEKTLTQKWSASRTRRTSLFRHGDVDEQEMKLRRGCVFGLVFGLIYLDSIENYNANIIEKTRIFTIGYPY